MRELLRRIGHLLRRARFERDLADEMAFHREMTTRDLEGRGLDSRDAALASRRAFGSGALGEDQARDVWIATWLQDVARDIRFAARLLIKDRAFTAVAVLALASGLAATNTIYTIVNAMVLRGLPGDDSRRIVVLSNAGGGPVIASYPDVEDWRAAQSFAGIAAFSFGAVFVTSDEGRTPEVAYGSFLSANAFRLVGETPLLGRDFVAADDVPGAPAVVILGYSVWSNRYGADPTIVGRTIRVNNRPTVVIGVMKRGFRFPLADEMWEPIVAMPGLQTASRDTRRLTAFGRLRDGATITYAQAELDAITARIAKDYPETDKNTRPVVSAYTDRFSHPMILALFGAVGFVLLIACANVANLLLSRSSQRSLEISIRISLGATRWHIVRQLLVESVLLSIGAGTIGLGLSLIAMKLFSNAVAGINLPYWYRDNWTMDARVFTFMATASLATAFVFGLAPALHAAKTDVHDSLKETARTGTAGVSARRWTSGLLVSEIAFTLVLLTGATLMMRSFLAIARTDSIVDASHVLTMSIRLPPDKYPTPDKRIAFFQRLEDRFDAVRPLSTAAFASSVPFTGGSMWDLTVDGRSDRPDDQPSKVSFVTIGGHYFEALGVHVVRGRAFTAIDGTSGHESAIITQRLVSMFFHDSDPVGQRICLSNPDSRSAAPLCAQIVGVSPTVRQQFMSEIDPVVYLPFRAHPGASAMLMVHSQDPTAIAGIVRDETRTLDADVAVYRPISLETWMEQSRWGHSVFGTMFAAFAAIALILAAIGLYAVTAYAVTQRTQEIGVRMALGAQTGDVVWLFMRRGLAPIAFGSMIGMAGAFGTGRLLHSLLVQTSPTDPTTFVSIMALLAVVAIAACYLPARRALRLDPMIALRCE